MIDFVTANRVLMNSSILELSLLMVCIHLVVDNARLRKQEAKWYWRNNEIEKNLVQMYDRAHYATMRWEQSIEAKKKE